MRGINVHQYQGPLKVLWSFVVGFFFNSSPFKIILISWHLTIYEIHIDQACLGNKASEKTWTSKPEISCHSDIVPNTPSSHYSQPFPQQPQRQIWQISIYGTCVTVACLIRSKQALICPPISVSPQHKFQVENVFLPRVEGFAAISLPFICMCVTVCIHVCACSCMCLCGGVWCCWSVCVCRCYLCNWI